MRKWAEHRQLRSFPAAASSAPTDACPAANARTCSRNARRWHSVRNTLWFAWLRRPLPSAVRRTLGTVRWDRASLRGFTAALAGLPWVLRERRVVPRDVEDRLRLLDARR